ncbi:MAG: hypothetical protein ACRCX2_14670 [Paraclostridium sp.]
MKYTIPEIEKLNLFSKATDEQKQILVDIIDQLDKLSTEFNNCEECVEACSDYDCLINKLGRNHGVSSYKILKSISLSKFSDRRFLNNDEYVELSTLSKSMNKLFGNSRCRNLLLGLLHTDLILTKYDIEWIESFINSPKVVNYVYKENINSFEVAVKYKLNPDITDSNLIALSYIINSNEELNVEKGSMPKLEPSVNDKFLLSKLSYVVKVDSEYLHNALMTEGLSYEDIYKNVVAPYTSNSILSDGTKVGEWVKVKAFSLSDRRIYVKITVGVLDDGVNYVRNCIPSLMDYILLYSEQITLANRLAEYIVKISNIIGGK